MTHCKEDMHSLKSSTILLETTVLHPPCTGILALLLPPLYMNNFSFDVYLSHKFARECTFFASDRMTHCLPMHTPESDRKKHTVVHITAYLSLSLCSNYQHTFQRNIGHALGHFWSIHNTT